MDLEPNFRGLSSKLTGEEASKDVDDKEVLTEPRSTFASPSTFSLTVMEMVVIDHDLVLSQACMNQETVLLTVCRSADHKVLPVS